LGQLIKIIRADFLIDAKGLNLVRGKPIGKGRIIEKINEMMGN
jgi:2-oxoglutarate ferredoxin oxidoreductase subunit alpha